LSENRQDDDRRRSDDAKRHLRGRNLAVLAALVVLVILVYLITVTRLEQGTERALENADEAESSFVIDPQLRDRESTT
jgi:hypothetical protein